MQISHLMPVYLAYWTLTHLHRLLPYHTIPLLTVNTLYLGAGILRYGCDHTIPLLTVNTLYLGARYPLAVSHGKVLIGW